MTKSKKILVLCMGVYLLTVFSWAHAQEAPMHSGQRFGEFFKQLNLTEAQKQQLQDNKRQHHSKMESDRQQMKALKDALQAELMASQLDMAKVNATHLQIKALQSQMEDDHLSSILAVRSILTPEQFSKFAILMNKRRTEHQDN